MNVNDVTTGSDPRAELGNRMRSMRRWRLVIGIGSVVLGLVLLATGHVLIGGLVAGLAAARLVMLSRMPMGRHQGPATPALRGWLRAQVPDEMRVAAGVIGCGADELRDHVRRGGSIAELAAERSVDPQQVIAAIEADLVTRAQGAVGTGVLPAQDATRVASVAPRVASRIVHGRRAVRPA